MKKLSQQFNIIPLGTAETTRVRLIHVFAELAAVYRMEAFGFLEQDVDHAVGEITHHGRQRDGCRCGDASRRRG